jgi:hypothetical protein
MAFDLYFVEETELPGVLNIPPIGNEMHFNFLYWSWPCYKRWYAEAIYAIPSRVTCLTQFVRSIVLVFYLCVCTVFFGNSWLIGSMFDFNQVWHASSITMKQIGTNRNKPTISLKHYYLVCHNIILSNVKYVTI